MKYNIWEIKKFSNNDCLKKSKYIQEEKKTHIYEIFFYCYIVCNKGSDEIGEYITEIIIWGLLSMVDN